MSERLFLLDGMALAYRAYFAFIHNPLKNAKGENTSAVFGFINALIKIRDEEKPDYIAVAFDLAEPTFRHKQYSEYKATREKMPEDMVPQLHYLKELTEAMGVPILEYPGYEADDVIGTLSVRAAQQGIVAHMVTGDKDFMQLIGPNIVMYNPLKKGGEKEIIGRDGVLEKFGVEPSQVTDILGLMGDAADNIPGVKGIGEKTAAKLINQYGSIEKIYEQIDSIKGKLRENLEQHKEDAFLSKSLATIALDVPLREDIHDLRGRTPDHQKVTRLLTELEFKSLIKKILKNESDLFVEDTPLQHERTPEPARNYHTLQTEVAIKELVTKLTNSGGFAWDTETTDADPMRAELVGFSFSWTEGEAFYIPCNGDVPVDTICTLLKPVLEDSTIPKWGQNTKYDIIIVSHYGIEVQGTAFDTMIAGHLLHSDKEVNIDALAASYLGIEKIPTTDLIGTGKNQITMRDVPIEKVSAYANEDADCVVRLKNVMSPLLKETHSAKIFNTIEMPLIPVLQRMERHGVWLDLEILGTMSKDFAVQITQEEQRIFKEAGTDFNMNSPQQLGEILFEKLQIHKLAGIEKPKLTGKTKQYATDVKILEQYRTLPIVEAILNYRQLTKLKSTYIDGLPPLRNPRTGRIHTTFNQTIAATGRLSSTNPNFQNIPIRTDMGREIRRAFTAQEKGWVLLSADYSQIELRVMAHMSGDENLIAAFSEDADIHTSTAARVFGVEANEVTKDLRRKAKDINFGVIYGISPFGLAQRIGMSQAEAREFIHSYFATYPKVKSYIESVIAKGKEDAFVTTLFGRRRYLPDLQSKNFTVRQFAERAATNTPIQGTAAEIIKMAMLKTHAALEKSSLSAKMVLQVHDELVFETPQAELQQLEALVRSSMESAVQMKVALKVDMGSGDNWLETK